MTIKHTVSEAPHAVKQQPRHPTTTVAGDHVGNHPHRNITTPLSISRRTHQKTSGRCSWKRKPSNQGRENGRPTEAYGKGVKNKQIWRRKEQGRRTHREPPSSPTGNPTQSHLSTGKVTQRTPDVENHDADKATAPEPPTIYNLCNRSIF